MSTPAGTRSRRRCGRLSPDRDESSQPPSASAGANVTEVPNDPIAIAEALVRALEPGYRESLRLAPGEAPDGGAGARVAHIIAAWRPPRPPRKPPIRVPE